MRRRGPCSGFVRGLQRTEAETKRGDIADTFRTRRVLVEEFRMMYWGVFCSEGIQEEAGQAGEVCQCLSGLTLPQYHALSEVRFRGPIRLYGFLSAAAQRRRGGCTPLASSAARFWPGENRSKHLRGMHPHATFRQWRIRTLAGRITRRTSG